MASNELPRNNDALFTEAEDMADGLHLHEVAIGVKQNLEADVRAALLVAQTAQSDYTESRAAKTALGAAQATADENGRQFIATTRALLVMQLGGDWSDAWLPTGFPNLSTAVPDTLDERQALLFALSTYLTNHPAAQNMTLGITPPQAFSFGSVLSDARSAVHEAANDSGLKKIGRDAAVLALRKRMRGLITELEQLLQDDDPVWNAFGLNPPGAPETPDIPAAPTLTPGLPGIININWPGAARADHYRVFKQVVGTDADFVFLASPHDPNLTANGFVTGTTVKVCLSAVNDAGESQRSDPAQIVVP